MPFRAFLDEFWGAVKDPAVDFFELAVRNGIARGIKIAEVAEREAKGIANFAIRFAELGHHALAHFYVGLVFDGADPKPHQIPAPLFATLDGVKRIAHHI